MKLNLKFVLRKFLPKSTLAHRILSGPLRGQRIITSWHDYPAAITGNTEKPLLKWFSDNVKRGTTWLDVGAHYGYTAIALSRLVGEEGRVFAFEPMLRTAGYLTQTRALNKFTQLNVLPLALGSSENIEMMQLPTTRGMVDSTILTRVRYEIHDELNENIMLARLDWLWPKICGEHPQIDGVKIDVQGMEIEALRGMLNLLKSFKPKLVLEVHKGVDRNELLNLITACGYSLHATPIQPVPGEAEAQYIDDMSYAFDTLQDKPI